MDSNFNTITSIVSLILSVGGLFLHIVNHKRIRSNCCGKQTEVSLDIENTTPPRDKTEQFVCNYEKYNAP